MSYAVEIHQQTEQFAALANEEVDLEEVGEEKMLEGTFWLRQGTEKGQGENAAHLGASEDHLILVLFPEELQKRELQ